MLLNLTSCLGFNSKNDNLNHNQTGIFDTKNGNKISNQISPNMITPLDITITKYDALSSLITVTNNNIISIPLTSDPIISSPAFILNTNHKQYKKPNTLPICANGVVLDTNDSCIMLIHVNNNDTTNIGNLTLITPTYTYVLKLSQAPIIYIAGNFAKASTSDIDFESSGITSFNDGTCGTNGDKSCLVLAYNTLTKEIQEIAEVQDEIYALLIDFNNNLLVAGAFNSLITPELESALILPDNITTKNNASTLIARINLTTGYADSYAHANQSVFAMTKSLVDALNPQIYLAGAFSAIAAGANINYAVNTHNQCAIVSNDGNNFINFSSGDGYVTSLIAINNNSRQDNIVIAGKFNTQLDTTLPNNSVGIVSCTEQTCNTYSPLVLDATTNLIAANYANRLLISGEFTSISGIDNNTHNNLLASGMAQTLGQFSLIQSADGMIKSLLSTTNGYIVGGNFSQINQTPVAHGLGFGKCGPLANNLCTLAQYTLSNANNLLFTDSDINAITSFTQLTINY